MRLSKRALLVGACLLALTIPAVAEPVQYNDTTVNSSGQTVTGPVPVSPSKPLPVTVSGGGSNAAASATGSAVPANGSYNALNVGGTLRGQTGANTSGSVYAADTNIVNEADGANATLGAKADSACGTDNGSCSLTALVKRTNQNITTLNTTAGTALPAQSSDGVKIGAVQGTKASGATADTYPLLNGGRAATAAPTAVTDGQAVSAQLTPEGRLVTAPYSIKELMVRGTATSTDTSAHTIIASAGGSLKNYITAAQCGRTDAGASALTITFNDSVSTVVVLPAGGATNITFPTPLATAAATAFQFTSGTGVSTLYCSAQGYTGL